MITQNSLNIHSLKQYSDKGFIYHSLFCLIKSFLLQTIDGFISWETILCVFVHSGSELTLPQLLDNFFLNVQIFIVRIIVIRIET